jgi:hypothetical protein
VLPETPDNMAEKTDIKTLWASFSAKNVICSVRAVGKMNIGDFNNL